MEFDLSQTDALLTTTRAVRKRLDLEKEVPRDLIEDCIDIAQQAPTGSNSQTWRFLMVDDAAKRKALGDLYRKGAEGYLTAASQQENDDQTQRVFSSAVYLMEHLQDVPMHVIPLVEGRPPEGAPVAAMSGLFGSIYPAIWSFQLALRSRGLGSVLTTLHLAHEKEAAEILGIPDNMLQVALLPVGWTVGTDFKQAKRPAASTIVRWNTWS